MIYKYIIGHEFGFASYDSFGVICAESQYEAKKLLSDFYGPWPEDNIRISVEEISLKNGEWCELGRERL